MPAYMLASSAHGQVLLEWHGLHVTVAAPHSAPQGLSVRVAG